MKRSVFLVLALAACDAPFQPPPPPPPPVAVVIVSPATDTVVAGDTLQLTVALQDSTGAPLTRTVLWRTPDSLIVQVSTTGAVRGVNAGAGRVIVESEGKADTATITVQPIILAQVQAGGTHSCAVGNNQHAYCWGYNVYGQGGIGTFGFLVLSPAASVGGHTYTSIATGADHTCARGTDDQVYCWGRNATGQLGRGATPGNASIPSPVAATPAFTAVAAGEAHSCALQSDSTAACWGYNVQGQLGEGSQSLRTAPYPVAGALRFRSISAGAFHTCAVTSADVAFCWGANGSGALGDSTFFNRPLPTAVRGGIPFRLVSAGANHTCGIAVGGAAWCWGGNDRGQLGAPPPAAVTAPAAVAGGLTFDSLSVGDEFSCGIATDSTAYCWGANDHGQLGDSSTTDRATPVAVHGGLKFSQLSAGRQHTCGVATDAHVYCWGSGLSGELGTGKKADSGVPVPVAGQP